MPDTLQPVGGVEQTLAAWGFQLASVKSIKRNQSDDTFTGVLTGTTAAAEADSPTFPFEQQVIVRVNRTLTGGGWTGGTVKFIGKLVTNPQRASGSGQFVTVTFKGVWYDFENVDYQQSFAGVVGVNTNNLVSEVVLFTGLSAADTNPTALQAINISVGDQIQAAVQFLLDTYAAQGLAAPFQYSGRALTVGTIDLTSTATVPGTVDNASKTLVYIFNGGSASPSLRYYKNQVPAKPTIDRQLYLSYLSTYIAKPMKIADVLKKCLELWPRTNIWFDYTTLAGDGKTPLPTLHVDVVDNMVPITLPLMDGKSHKSLNIVRRDDLLVRAVVITYKISQTVNSNTYYNYVFDQWGKNGSNSYFNAYQPAYNAWLAAHATDYIGANAAGVAAANAAILAGTADPISGLRVVSETVDLSGGAVTTVQGHLDTEPILAIGGTQATKRTWWSSKRGGEVSKLEDLRVRFQDKNGNQTTIPDATVVDATTGANVDLTQYPNRIVRGEHCAWMTLTGGASVISKKIKILAAMQFCEYDSAGASDTDLSGRRLSVLASAEQHANLEVTNGVTGAYSTISSQTPGEAYIVGAGGIAQYLYLHMNVYQFDGEYAKVETNFVDSTAVTYVHPGRSLNFSNGANAWKAMNAQIQEITEDYGTHTTSIKIGIAKHLNAQQLSSLLNMWRFRRPWFNPLVRANNALTNGGTVDQAVTSGNANTTAGLENKSQLALTQYTTPGDPTSAPVAGISLDTSLMTLAKSL